jgi:hypothetical protein
MPISVIDLQTELIRAMTPDQKLRISQSLRETAWDAKAAWIRSTHPKLPEPEVQAEVRRLFRDAGA